MVRFSHLKCIVIGVICVFASGLMTTTSAGPWFKHRFGELRAYHGDWLNVCEDGGAGQCRTVQTYVGSGKDRFFGESKLSVYIEHNDRVSVEVYDMGMPALTGASLRFDFGDQIISVPADQWRIGARDAENVAETVFIPPSEISTRLVTLIRAKARLKVTYPLHGADSGIAPFSLRGSNAAIAALKTHMATRRP